jgi:hypothetical protein
VQVTPKHRRTAIFCQPTCHRSGVDGDGRIARGVPGRPIAQSRRDRSTRCSASRAQQTSSNSGNPGAWRDKPQPTAEENRLHPVRRLFDQIGEAVTKRFDGTSSSTEPTGNSTAQRLGNLGTGSSTLTGFNLPS